MHRAVLASIPGPSGCWSQLRDAESGPGDNPTHRIMLRGLKPRLDQRDLRPVPDELCILRVVAVPQRDEIAVALDHDGFPPPEP
jgi:hypothetical protein